MPISARHHGSARHAERGFTLLEIMATVGLVGIVLLPILMSIEYADNRTYRATHMLRATSYAQEIVADLVRESRAIEGEQGVIEDDPAFRYELDVEDFNLATGRADGEEDDDDLFGDRDRSLVPADAGTGEGVDKNDPYLVRRYQITVYWPSFVDENEEQITLEGFLPRVWEEEYTPPGARR